MLQSFLSYAFRPFFLLNGLFAIVAVAIWLFTLDGFGPASLPVNSKYWHGHEMLVGFAMAAIAGFILTAVATWTGRPPLSGAPLGLLVLSWLVGRITMGFAALLPATVVMLLDMLFPLLLVAFVAREVIGGGSQRNYPIVLITVFLAASNLLFHLSGIGVLDMAMEADRIALYLLVHLVLVLITVIAGRIVPNFTANWLRARGQSRLPLTSPRLDRITILLTLAAGLFAAFLPVSALTGTLAIVAAMAHGLRLSRWRGLATWSEPLLFVLHAAYLWLPLGYLLLASAVFTRSVPATIALHALTMGAIGFMIMGVSTRVALAHTGRKLHAARLTVFAYWMLMLAVCLRVLSPFSQNYLVMVDLSGAAWMLAFAVFTWVYWPVLTSPAITRDSQAEEAGSSG